MTIRFLTIIAIVAAGLAAQPCPVAAQDAAELTVRVNRLENQLRQLSGQIEQLQFENRRQAEQLRKFQEDVEFRLSQGAGAGRPGVAPPAASPGTAPAQTPRPRQSAAPDPVLPGAGAPVDLNQQARALPQGAVQPGSPPERSVAATAAQTPRALYDAAMASLTAREYEQAEMGFRQFIQSNPRSPLVSSATYWLGESFFRRNRHRDAAEHYLKVTTDFADARIAPEAMLKLGMSLSAIGAREQACATYARVNVRYPQAPETVRTGVTREQRRARCDG